MDPRLFLLTNIETVLPDTPTEFNSYAIFGYFLLSGEKIEFSDEMKGTGNLSAVVLEKCKTLRNHLRRS